MKILLLGEYSNVHWTLAQGLRCLGHEVTVVSNGDFWKNYPRDIDVARSIGRFGGVRLLARILRLLPQLRGYDVVQLINPMFFELKAERLRPIYHYLRNHNGKMFLGAFGMDYYWVHECITRYPLRYSDFNFGRQLRTNKEALIERHDWIGTAKGLLNQYIAHDCDGIIAGLYEYWACYQPLFPQKTVFIPFPIQPKQVPEFTNIRFPIKIFIGISKGRNAYKGTDIMLKAAQKVKALFPDKVQLQIAEGVPFAQYTEMLRDSHLILDQLYSYTPSMNPLEAMSRGIVCVGGGEPENYTILNEDNLRPIINVLPNEKSVFEALQHVVLHPEQIVRLQNESVAYIAKHHDYRKVAQKYLNFWLDN